MRHIHRQTSYSRLLHSIRANCKPKTGFFYSLNRRVLLQRSLASSARSSGAAWSAEEIASQWTFLEYGSYVIAHYYGIFLRLSL